MFYFLLEPRIKISYNVPYITSFVLNINRENVAKTLTHERKTNHNQKIHGHIAKVPVHFAWYPVVARERGVINPIATKTMVASIGGIKLMQTSAATFDEKADVPMEFPEPKRLMAP